MLAACAVIALSVSCSDNYKEKDIVGTWDLRIVEVTAIEDGKVVEEYSGTENIPAGTVSYRFNKNNTLDLYEDGEWYEDGDKWSLSGDKITITYIYSNGDTETNVWYIEDLKNSKAIVNTSYIEDGITFNGRMTLEKR